MTILILIGIIYGVYALGKHDQEVFKVHEKDIKKKKEDYPQHFYAEDFETRVDNF